MALASSELGVFIGYRLGGAVHGQEKIGVDLSIVHDVSDVYGGALITGHVSYVGNTANSPIISEGSKTVGLMGVAGTYLL